MYARLLVIPLLMLCSAPVCANGIPDVSSINFDNSGEVEGALDQSMTLLVDAVTKINAILQRAGQSNTKAVRNLAPDYASRLKNEFAKIRSAEEFETTSFEAPEAPPMAPPLLEEDIVVVDKPRATTIAPGRKPGPAAAPEEPWVKRLAGRAEPETMRFDAVTQEIDELTKAQPKAPADEFAIRLRLGQLRKRHTELKAAGQTPSAVSAGRGAGAAVGRGGGAAAAVPGKPVAQMSKQDIAKLEASSVASEVKTQIISRIDTLIEEARNRKETQAVWELKRLRTRFE